MGVTLLLKTPCWILQYGPNSLTWLMRFCFLFTSLILSEGVETSASILSWTIHSHRLCSSPAQPGWLYLPLKANMSPASNEFLLTHLPGLEATSILHLSLPPWSTEHTEFKSFFMCLYSFFMCHVSSMRAGLVSDWFTICKCALNPCGWQD